MNRPGRFRRGGWVHLAAAVAPWSLGAQEGVRIRGVVVEAETGEPVAGARVLVRHTPLQTTADAAGGFAIALPGRGDYTLFVAADGFRAEERAVQAGPPAAKAPLRIELERLLFEVPSLNVTVNRGTRPGDVSTSVAVISGDELERRNVTSLDEALPFAQGVTFNAGNMDIRGSTGIARGVGSRVLMLLDGHRTLSGVESSIDFGVLPILDVERIEIVKGPHSTLWGTNALGGVVNVITRPPLGETRTVVRGYYGLFDTPSHLSFTDRRLSMRGVQLQHSQRIGPAHATVFLGREGTDGFRQNGRMDRWRVRAKAIFKAESTTPWELFASWKSQDAEEFFTWASSDRPLEVDPRNLEDWKQQSDLIAGLTAIPLATSRLKLELRPQIHYFRSENHFHDNGDFHESTRYRTDLQLSLYTDNRHTLTVGGDAAYTSVASNFLDTAGAAGAKPGVTGLTPYVTDLAVFAQDEIEFSERLQASVGLRFDLHRVSFVENDLALNPKIGVVYRPSEPLSLRVSVSRGYRAPSVSERFTSTTVFGFRVVPNLGLRGESAWAGEIGATMTPGDRIWFDAGLFWSEYSGLIEVATTPGDLFGSFQFRNVPEARIRGLDTGVRVGLVPEKLNLNANYMYLDSEDRRSGKALTYRSSNNLTATLSAWTDLIALDLQHRSEPETVIRYPNDERGSVTLLDLRLNVRVRDMDVQTKVANLLQAEYVDVQERNPGASRSFRVTVTSRF